MGLREDLLSRAKDRRQRHREEVTAILAQAGWGDLCLERRLYAQRMSGHAYSTYHDYRDQYGPDPAGGFGAVKRTGLNLKNIDAVLCVRCLADETGALLFAEADAEALGQADADLLGALAAVCRRVNGMAVAADDGDKLKNAPGGAGSGAPPANLDAPPTSCSSPSTPPA